MTSKPIEAGSHVTMHFRLSLDSGFIVEDSHDSEPLSIQIGDGSLVKGLELAIMGLKPGEKSTIELESNAAFGSRDDERIMEMDKAEFPEELAIEKGQIIGFTAPSGDEVAGAVLEIREDTVLVDFNHPLAGKRVVFDVEILNVD